MNTLRFLSSISLLSSLFALTARAQISVAVDPVNGDDALITSPDFKTISAALAAVQASPTTPSTITLRAGEYSTAANGEVFPLQVTHTDLTIRGERTRGATLKKAPFTSPPMIEILPTSSGGSTSTSITLADFSMDASSSKAIVSRLGNAGTVHLSLSDLDILGGLAALHAFAGSDTSSLTTLDVVIDRCTLHSNSTTVFIQVDIGGSGTEASLSMTNCDVKTIGGPNTRGVFLYAGDSSSDIVSSIVSTVLRTAQTGLRCDALGGGMRIHSVVDHCVFYDLGRFDIFGVPHGGGIVDTSFGSAAQTVTNSIFWDIVGDRDVPNYGSADTVAYSLVHQASLVLLGTNITGDPKFVNAAGADFHLLQGNPASPTSPAIDAGTTVSSIRDVDGEPRADCDCSGGSGLPDMGIDEVYDHTMWWTPRYPVINTTATLCVAGVAPIGGTTETCAVYCGPAGAGPYDCGLNWCTGAVGSLKFDPTGFAPFAITPATSIGASGLLQFSVAIPNSPALVGYPIAYQALYSYLGGARPNENLYVHTLSD